MIDHIESHPEFIQPESRKNEMLNNFIKPGLQDLCVSRTSFKWGIPVDFDDKHVVYVWIDALSNYITSLGFDADGNHGENYKKYWPADVHVIGKDILRFHTIYWPIMLMALGQDGTITWELMIERINSDLANVLGNLVNRTISMTNKYFAGVVSNPEANEPLDEELKQAAMNAVKGVEKKMDELRVGDAIAEIFVLLKRCNKYIDETTPWTLAKEGKNDRLATVLYNLLEGIRIAAILLEPFLPETAEKIFAQLNTEVTDLDTCESFGHLECGKKVIAKPEILFARIDAKEMLDTIEKDHEKAAEPLKEAEEAEKKPEITFDDFSKIELKTGTILKCEKHPKADKLLVSQIDVGNGDVRQIVSGIATHFTPEDMVGRQVIVVTNLKPAKLRGVESQGMILVGETANDEQLALAACDLPNGSIVR